MSIENSLYDYFFHQKSKNYKLSNLVTSYSKDDVIEMVTKIAISLESKVNPEEVVGIIMNRSIEAVITILALNKLGVTYVPISPEYPTERINYIFNEAKLKFVICLDKPKLKIRYHLFQTLVKNEDDRWLSERNNSVKSEIIAIIFTSGTTGIPKGVKVTSAGIISLVKNHGMFRVDSSRDTLLLTNNICFDGANFDIWTPILHGIPQIILEGEISIRKFNNYIDTFSPTILHMSTALFHILVRGHSENFKNIKYLIVGGDKLSLAHGKYINDKYTELKLINSYGPTENGCISSYFDFDWLINDDEVVPIGVPTGDTIMEIVDEEGNISNIGEIIVSGKRISPGYLSDELTDRSFMTLTYGGKLEKFYKTGDYGQKSRIINKKQCFHFQGRKDRLIKVRGFLVNPIEIEQVINNKFSNTIARVLPVKDGYEEQRLILFVEKSQISLKKLKEAIEHELPDYMIPREYLEVNQILLTPNGKVDDAKLIRIYENSKLTSEIMKDVEEDDLVSLKLKKIWREIFAYAIYQKELDFFDLGGDSLKAILLIEEIEKEYQIQLEMSDIFLNSNFNLMKDLIEKRMRGDN